MKCNELLEPSKLRVCCWKKVWNQLRHVKTLSYFRFFRGKNDQHIPQKVLWWWWIRWDRISKKTLKNKQKLWIKPIIYLISPFQPDKFLNPSPDISFKNENTNPGHPHWDPTDSVEPTQRSPPFFLERNFSSVFFHRDVVLAGWTNKFKRSLSNWIISSEKSKKHPETFTCWSQT